MKRPTHNWQAKGFTLLELLSVIALITVLASLLLGPAARVLQRLLADKWSEDAAVLLGATVKQLHEHFQGEQTFPIVTLERIEAEGFLKPNELGFLKDPRVTFVPFEGADPDDKIVIVVQLKHGFFTDRNSLIERKEAITRVPN